MARAPVSGYVRGVGGAQVSAGGIASLEVFGRQYGTRGRKVRAPQGKVPGNAWSG